MHNWECGLRVHFKVSNICYDFTLTCVVRIKIWQSMMAIMACCSITDHHKWLWVALKAPGGEGGSAGAANWRTLAGANQLVASEHQQPSSQAHQPLAQSSESGGLAWSFQTGVERSKFRLIVASWPINWVFFVAGQKYGSWYLRTYGFKLWCESSAMWL